MLHVARADFHASQNVCSVYFTKTDACVFDVLILELCQPPYTSVVPALVARVNKTEWHNEYVA